MRILVREEILLESKSHEQLGIPKPRVIARGVADRRRRAPGGESVIPSHGHPGRQHDVGAGVVQSRQRVTATDRLTDVSECRWLKRTSTLVPEVVAVGHTQRMNIGPDRETFGGSEHQLAECVRAVHQVEEREARIQARRRKHLEERAVHRVARVANVIQQHGEFVTAKTSHGLFAIARLTRHDVSAP